MLPFLVPTRDERIARIRRLQDMRLHPERVPGAFSATNLTRLTLLLVLFNVAHTMSAAVPGPTVLKAVVGMALAGAASLAFDRAWARLEPHVVLGWKVLACVASGALLVTVLAEGYGPQAGDQRGLEVGWERFKDRQDARVQQRRRARHIPVPHEASSGIDWELLTIDGRLHWLTYADAQAACAALGPGWRLPAPPPGFPELHPAPALPVAVPIWLEGGHSSTLVQGGRVGGFAVGPPKPFDVEGALCVR